MAVPAGDRSLASRGVAEPGPPYRGRFAPSPTGSLHLGNARTALVAWVRARVAGGAFVLRLEDIDGPRTRHEAVLGNLAELRWLGLDWDEGPDVGGACGPYRQSERGDLYTAALERLSTTGAVFDCYLSRKDVATASSAPHGQPGAGAVYGPEQRRLNRAVAAARRDSGRTPSVRLRSDAADATPRPTGPVVPAPATVEFEDAIAGRQVFDVATQVGDIVLRRSDGLWAYQLAVVVDDAAMGITEVVRGADLLPSTAAQVLVYRALGLEPPAFAHVGLVLGEDGRRLAKRDGSQTLAELTRAGVAPERLVGLLAATLGWLEEPRPVTAAGLVATVDPGVLASAPAHDVRLSRADAAFLTGA